MEKAIESVDETPGTAAYVTEEQVPIRGNAAQHFRVNCSKQHADHGVDHFLRGEKGSQPLTAFELAAQQRVESKSKRIRACGQSSYFGDRIKNVGQAITALTDWAVKPLRRVLPGFKGQDTSTIFLAWLAQFVWLLATVLLVRRVVPDGSAVLVFALFAVVELFKAALWVLIVAVIVQAVLSWVGPEGALAGFLNAMTFRFLAPIRRMIPPIGGSLDLSPLILIVVLQLVLMVPLPWLESVVLGLAA